MRRIMPLLLIVAALTGCSSSGGTVDSTESVCDDFAQFVHDGRPADQRSAVVSSIGEVIGNAHQRVQDAYGALKNTVNASADAQSIADDTFAQACFDAGWNG